MRRVAVALRPEGVPFVHEPISVIRRSDALVAIDPVVKPPTQVPDGGTMLVHPTQIPLFAERSAAPRRRLAPEEAVRSSAPPLP